MTKNNVIQVGELNWKTPSDSLVGIYCAVAVSRDEFAMSFSLEGPRHSLYEPYCRLLKYKDGRWVMFELDTCIVSMVPCLGIPGDAAWSKPGLAALSYDGFVRFLGDSMHEEPITGTEVDPVDEDDSWFSALAAIRRIGDDLLVCGSDRQLYRRSNFVNWARDDNGFREPPPKSDVEIYASISSSINFTDVASPDGGDNLYLCGRKGIAEGILYHRLRSDKIFRRIPLPKDSDLLKSVYPENLKKIWLCGSGGTLLIGNSSDGFGKALLAPQDRKILFNSVVLYKGIHYVGARFGLYRYENGKLEKLILPGVSPEQNYRIDDNILQVINDVLWVFGHHGHVMRFDGAVWDKIVIPALGGKEGHR